MNCNTNTKSFNRSYLMGDVAAMSGKAILGNKIMDWAFVRLVEPAAESFFRPNAIFPVPPDQMSSLYNPELAIPVPEGTPLAKFGDLEKGQYYLKLGRSTGITLEYATAHLHAATGRVRIVSDTNMMDSKWTCHPT